MNLRCPRRLRHVLSGLVLACALSACGSDRYVVIGTAKAPSTSGFVEMEDTRDDGATILVHLEHLHPARHVDPSASHYAVWLDGGRGAPVFAGVLRYDPDHRTGELRVESPFPKFIVKITAEANDKPGTPSELEVASQEVSVDD